MVTELVAGRTLADRLNDPSPLTESEATLIAARVCEALEHIHGLGIVHYDVKPANVMLCPDGGVRLIDFGLAHRAVERKCTFSGAAPAIGSANYVAPEQIRRKRGRKSVDIYAVGAMLYKMLTGQPPFPGDDPFVVASARLLGDPQAPRRVNPSISPQVEDIVLRALRRDPTERYPSAAAMGAVLEHPERVAIAGFCDRLEPVTRWRRVARIARYVAIVGVLPIVMQVGLFFVFRDCLGHAR
jgi:serine/threonine-protein kinase